MGLFDFLKIDDMKEHPPKSKYEKLPLIDPKKDSETKKGYVERKYVDSEYVYGRLHNLYKYSEVPIVKELDFINNDLSTMVLKEKLGRKVRSTNEYFYYVVPESLQQQFIDIVSMLNKEITAKKLPKHFLVNLKNISFQTQKNGQVPRSRIKYNPDKKEFEFYFSDSKTRKISSSTNAYEEYNTEFGFILFNEDGTIKKAEFNRELGDVKIKTVFKMYKTGFELYEAKYMGELVYRRN